MDWQKSLENFQIWFYDGFLEDYDFNTLVYYSFAFVFFYFGLQKLIPGSAPVGPDVRAFVSAIGLPVQTSWYSYFIGTYEMILGIFFYFKQVKKAALLFIPHQITVFLPLIFVTDITFVRPYLKLGNFLLPWNLDYFGAFILKNLVFASAFLKILKEDYWKDYDVMAQGYFYRALGLILILALIGSLAFAIHHPNGVRVVDLGNQLSDEKGSVKFENKAAELGLNYSVKNNRDRKLEAGGGVYVSDTDNDDRQEILLTGGKKPILYDKKNSSYSRVRTFPEITLEKVLSAHFVDIDRDGWEDAILFPKRSPPIVLENREGDFEIISRVDVAHELSPMGAISGDFDRDGCLEIVVYQAGTLHEGGHNYYISNNDCDFDLKRSYSFNNSKKWNNLSQNGISNFKDVKNYKKDVSVTFAGSAVDLNEDGLVDIHFGNDFDEDIVMINHGNGNFSRVELNDKTNREAMASEVADISGNGRPDIFVSNIRRNNLLVNKENQIFQYKAKEYGFHTSTWGWATLMEDFNNNGALEVFHTNSINFAPAKPPFWIKDSKGEYIRQYNHGISEKSSAGAARFDYNNDGYLDILRMPRFILNGTEPGLKMGELAVDPKSDKEQITVGSKHNNVDIMENEGYGSNYLKVSPELENGAPAIGARVIITYGNKNQTRFLNSKSGYLSQSSRNLHFGLDNKEQADRLTVDWLNGDKTVIQNLSANQEYRIVK